MVRDRVAENESSVNPPNRRPSKFHLIPITDDRAFPPDCDLLSIRQDPETRFYSLDSSTEETQYITGDSTLSMRRFPNIALRNIKRIRSRMSRKVGIHPIVSVCISYGLTKIRSNEWIQKLVELNRRCEHIPENFPGLINSTIHSFLSRFEVSIPDGSPLNPKLHARTDGNLYDLSSEIGVSRIALASLSVCYTIADQLNTNIDDKKEMEGFVDLFFESARVRAMAVKSLMDTFGVPEDGEEGQKRRRGRKPE